MKRNTERTSRKAAVPTVKSNVLKFMKNTVSRRKTRAFTGSEVAAISHASGLRTLRKLREQNVLVYEVVNGPQSTYRLTVINQ